MKNFKTENFIAFTLSEMMIVLLIISVISAATIPAITRRKEIKPLTFVSNWFFDTYAHTAGYFYANNNETDVIIGKDIKNASASDKTAYIAAYGYSPLKLMRNHYLPYSVNAMDKNSDIAFFDYGGRYEGKIAAGIGRNSSSLAMGEFSGLYNLPNAGDSNNVFAGIYAGYNLKQKDTAVEMARNLIMGSYAAYSSYINRENVILAQDSSGLGLGDGNVVIGALAGKNSYSNGVNGHKESVSIGSYASYNAKGLLYGNNIGYYAGANETQNGPYYNAINIGAKSGFKSAIVDNEIHSNINIGSYAGSERSTNNRDTINVGYFAGYKSNLNATNIGAYAGVDNSSTYPAVVNIGAFSGGGYHSSTDGYFVNLGYYAGYDTSNSYDVNVGNYAGYNMGSASNANQYNVNIGLYSAYKSNYKDSVAIGQYAGKNATVGGSGNVFIGYDIGNGLSSSSHPNVFINCGITGSQGESRMCIGGAGGITGDKWVKSNDNPSTMITTPGILSSSTVGWNYTSIFFAAKYVISLRSSMTKFSDRSLKENIRKTKYGIDKLKQLNVYQFNMKGSKAPQIGVIAQEVMKIYPDAVTELPQKIDGKTYYTVSPSWFIFSLAQAIKDVDRLTIDLQKELSENIIQTQKLSLRVNKLGKRFDNISQSNKTLNKKLDEIDVIINKTERKK